LGGVEKVWCGGEGHEPELQEEHCARRVEQRSAMGFA
jgi:hypothetical protein